LRLNFEWDPNKARDNARKHKVTFERAAKVFLDAFQISIFDDEHSEDEERWITTGKNGNEILLVVIHTFSEISDQERTIRIISARKATKKEKKQYERS
jgi:hypothetical protein